MLPGARLSSIPAPSLLLSILKVAQQAEHGWTESRESEEKLVVLCACAHGVVQLMMNSCVERKEKSP